MFVTTGVVAACPVFGNTATHPPPQVRLVELQLLHAAFALLQFVAFVPPFVLLQCHVRVVPHAVKPLSFAVTPELQPPATALLHTPGVGAGVQVLVVVVSTPLLQLAAAVPV